MPDPLRVQLLLKGSALTDGDRNREYGEPFDNLSNCAMLWQAYLYGKYGGDSPDFFITAEDVAWLNVLQQIARTFNGVYREDTYIDGAVYSAIAGEVAKVAEEAR